MGECGGSFGGRLNRDNIALCLSIFWLLSQGRLCVYTERLRFLIMVGIQSAMTRSRFSAEAIDRTRA